MDTINPSQQGSWENNVYFLTTTRILMALGLTFLIRSVYQLFQRMRSADGNGGAAVARRHEAIEVDLESFVLGALGEAATFDAEPANGPNETLEITLPQPTYSPQAKSSPSPVSLRQQE